MSSDSEYAPSESDSGSDASSVDSFATVQGNMEMLTTMISMLIDEIDEVEEHLRQLQRPIESIALQQLGDVPFLAASPFRKQTFTLKEPGFPGADCSRRYSFEEICGVLRNYLIRTGAFLPDGRVAVPEPLRKLFEITEAPVQYIALLAHLRKILV